MISVEESFSLGPCGGAESAAQTGKVSLKNLVDARQLDSLHKAETCCSTFEDIQAVKEIRMLLFNATANRTKKDGDEEGACNKTPEESPFAQRSRLPTFTHEEYMDLRSKCESILQSNSISGDGIPDAQSEPPAVQSEVLCLYGGDEILFTDETSEIKMLFDDDRSTNTNKNKLSEFALGYIKAVLCKDSSSLLPTLQRFSGEACLNFQDSSSSSAFALRHTWKAIKLLCELHLLEELIFCKWEEMVSQFLLIALSDIVYEEDSESIILIIIECFHMAGALDQRYFLVQFIEAAMRSERNKDQEDSCCRNGETMPILLKLIIRAAKVFSGNWNGVLETEIHPLLCGILELSSHYLKIFTALDPNASWLEQWMRRPSVVKQIAVLPYSNFSLVERIANGVLSCERYAVKIFALMLPPILNGGRCVSCIRPSSPSAGHSPGAERDAAAEVFTADLGDLHKIIFRGASPILRFTDSFDSSMLDWLLDSFYLCRHSFCHKISSDLIVAVLNKLKDIEVSHSFSQLRALLQLLLSVMTGQASGGDGTIPAADLNAMQSLDDWLRQYTLSLTKMSSTLQPEKAISICLHFCRAIFPYCRLPGTLDLYLSLAFGSHDSSSLFKYGGSTSVLAEVIVAASINTYSWGRINDFLRNQCGDKKKHQRSNDGTKKAVLKASDLLRAIIVIERIDEQKIPKEPWKEKKDHSAFPKVDRLSCMSLSLLQRWASVSNCLDERLAEVARASIKKYRKDSSLSDHTESDRPVFFPFIGFTDESNKKKAREDFNLFQQIHNFLLIAELPFSSFNDSKSDHSFNTSFALLDSLWNQICNGINNHSAGFSDSLLYAVSMFALTLWIEPSGGNVAVSFLSSEKLSGSPPSHCSVLTQISELLRRNYWIDPVTILLSAISFSFSPHFSNDEVSSHPMIQLILEIMTYRSECESALPPNTAQMMEEARNRSEFTQLRSRQNGSSCQIISEVLLHHAQHNKMPREGIAVMRDYLLALQESESDEQQRGNTLQMLRAATTLEWSAFCAASSSPSFRLMTLMHRHHSRVVDYLRFHGVDAFWVAHIALTQWLSCPQSPRAHVRRTSVEVLSVFLLNGIEKWEEWIADKLVRFFCSTLHDFGFEGSKWRASHIFNECPEVTLPHSFPKDFIGNASAENLLFSIPHCFASPLCIYVLLRGFFDVMPLIADR